MSKERKHYTATTSPATDRVFDVCAQRSYNDLRRVKRKRALQGCNHAEG